MPNTIKVVEIDHIREKLIELLSVGVRCPITVRCDACEYHDLDRFNFCNEEAATADMLIAHGVTIPEWISVKDRLPQDDLPFGALCEIVQVLLDDGTVTVGWCNRGLKCWYYMPIQATRFVGHDYDKTPVVAWQPLSQPPKGE